jgi:hypothetical protein
LIWQIDNEKDLTALQKFFDVLRDAGNRSYFVVGRWNRRSFRRLSPENIDEVLAPRRQIDMRLL